MRAELLDTTLGDRSANQELLAAAGLAHLGLVDPSGIYRLLAINLFMLAVDESRLQGRPVPRGWAQLLGPDYEGLVVTCGHEARMSRTLLLNIRSRFGTAGLEALGRNAAGLMHPAQVLKLAGSGRPESPAVSIVPLFFAKTAGDKLTMVWPEDGAMAVPLFFLLRADAGLGCRAVADFLTGEQLARICAGAWLPSMHPDGLPAELAGLPISWSGWNLLHDQDIGLLAEDAHAAVRRGAARQGRA